ncbi:DUF4276 family protein [Kutzneria sp. NPDC051319]|uniref:DUF4276 family protein n=1 Tax=Kutzneria sp. NPDC051319 TaxID=3155047 RepID=UPI00342DA60F
MTLPVIAPVVEGHGDAKAFPVLLRRIGWELNWPMNVAQPFRVPRSKLADPGRLAEVVMAASAAVSGAGGVVVLFDADDDCPCRLRESLDETARATFASTELVFANREFEAWFLASLPSLRSHASVGDDASFDGDPELPRGAKERLAKVMLETYHETLHQTKFSSLIDLETTWRNSRSFRRLISALQGLLEVDPPPWSL